MKNKGFTLIELLAVIVILAIIALIATPTILGVVETSRKGAAESSLLGFIDAVEKQIMINELDESKPNVEDGVYTLTDNGIRITYEFTYMDVKVDVKGQRPDKSYGQIEIKNGQVQNTTLKVDKYYVTYDSSTGKASASLTQPE